MRSWLLLLVGCTKSVAIPDATVFEDVAVIFDAAATDSEAPDAGDAGVDPPDLGGAFVVEVTLDGVPISGARVGQGGTDRFVYTDQNGRARLIRDETVRGEWLVVASHSEARIQAAFIEDFVRLELTRFGPDNPLYRFQDPGEPTRRNTSAQCGHCHRTFNDQWFGSVHQRAAQNPVVQDMYRGQASAIQNEADCETAGGRWSPALAPGAATLTSACVLGDGALPTLNPGCEDPCETNATNFGACADCHAPGMDGVLGGRNLAEATQFAFDYGVHCDVCHRVERVNLAAPAGVAGRLQLQRPSEPGSPALGAGGYLPLTFGPSHDSPNVRMGSVQRNFFRSAELCAGCHQLDHAEPGLDPLRWPDGRLPVQSTFAEWAYGVLSDVAPCQECHQPPEPRLGNGADIQDALGEPGQSAGWFRPPGQVRSHAFIGPRNSRILENALAVLVRKSNRDGLLEALVTVKNVAAGHAVPTGEPMRHLVLQVQASCGATVLEPVGGDVVPGFGGYRAQKGAGEDWSLWPEAQVGDQLRVIRFTGGHHDYLGFGPFGDGRFSAEAKGMLVESWVGASTIVATENEVVTLDAPLPAGDRVYLVRPARGDWAGLPGFGFARVLADLAGRTMVPHFLATDIISDNRLLPQQSWTSTHRFAATCAEPTVHAQVYYRPYPLALAQERRWPMPERVIAEGRR